jgi:multisubunit Na+/H+ antiporter MnhG subunit
VDILNNFFSYFFTSSGCFIILVSLIAIYRSKDFFSKVQIIVIANIYGVSLVLIGYTTSLEGGVAEIIKISLIIILNIIITIMVSQLLIKKLNHKKIDADAIVSKTNKVI